MKGTMTRLSVRNAVRNLLKAWDTNTKEKVNTIVVTPVTEKREEIMENTKVVKVLEDTERTVYCKRCGRKLKNPIYQELGYGKICYSKVNLYPGVKPLFAIKESEEE